MNKTLATREKLIDRNRERLKEERLISWWRHVRVFVRINEWSRRYQAEEKAFLQAHMTSGLAAFEKVAEEAWRREMMWTSLKREKKAIALASTIKDCERKKKKSSRPPPLVQVRVVRCECFLFFSFLCHKKIKKNKMSNELMKTVKPRLRRRSVKARVYTPWERDRDPCIHWRGGENRRDSFRTSRTSPGFRAFFFFFFI